MTKLDKLGDILFGRIGDRITKWGIALCGLVFLVELIAQVV